MKGKKFVFKYNNEVLGIGLLQLIGDSVIITCSPIKYLSIENMYLNMMQIARLYYPESKKYKIWIDNDDELSKKALAEDKLDFCCVEAIDDENLKKYVKSVEKQNIPINISNNSINVGMINVGDIKIIVRNNIINASINLDKDIKNEQFIDSVYQVLLKMIEESNKVNEYNDYKKVLKKD